MTLGCLGRGPELRGPLDQRGLDVAVTAPREDRADLGRQIAGALEPLAPIASRRAVDDLRHLCRQLGAVEVEVEGPLPDEVREIRRAGKRARAGNQRVQDAPEREDVSPGVDVRADRLLWRHVPGGALRDPRLGRVPALVRERDAEVGQHHVASPGHQDVARLDVAMNDPQRAPLAIDGGVGVRQGVADLSGDVQGEVDGEVRAGVLASQLQQLLAVHAVDQLEDLEGHAIGDPVVEDPDDARVMQEAGDPRLVEEHLHGGRLLRRLRQDPLEGDASLETSGADRDRFEHLRHSAPPDLAAHTVASGACHESGGQ